MNHISYEAARANLWKAQKRFKFFPNLRMTINDEFNFLWQVEDYPPMTKADRERPYLNCHLKPEMLEKLLRREVHWNNLEIGAWIQFDRNPNVYLPDVHTLMSFFHA